LSQNFLQPVRRPVSRRRFGDSPPRSFPQGSSKRSGGTIELAEDTIHIPARPTPGINDLDGRALVPPVARGFRGLFLACRCDRINARLVASVFGLPAPATRHLLEGARSRGPERDTGSQLLRLTS